MGAKDCCLMGLRKKRCGASYNEDIRTLFILKWRHVLRSRGGRIARWKVFRGVWVSRLENVQQGGDVASFETKRRFKQVGELLQVVVGGGVPSIIYLSFVIIGFLNRITLYYLVIVCELLWWLLIESEEFPVDDGITALAMATVVVSMAVDKIRISCGLAS
ncbi:hypothetical protein Tco_0317405 [Tanacetum coccineum]